VEEEELYYYLIDYKSGGGSSHGAGRLHFETKKPIEYFSDLLDAEDWIEKEFNRSNVIITNYKQLKGKTRP